MKSTKVLSPSAVKYGRQDYKTRLLLSTTMQHVDKPKGTENLQSIMYAITSSHEVYIYCVEQATEELLMRMR